MIEVVEVRLCDVNTGQVFAIDGILYQKWNNDDRNNVWSITTAGIVTLPEATVIQPVTKLTASFTETI